MAAQAATHLTSHLSRRSVDKNQVFAFIEGENSLLKTVMAVDRRKAKKVYR